MPTSSMQDPSKFTQIGISDFKICHLATLLVTWFSGIASISGPGDHLHIKVNVFLG
jgi:hypothetical protein